MAEGGGDPSRNNVSITNTSEEVSEERDKFSSFRVFQEPLCLVQNAADGRFSIVEDVWNQISQIDRTVNVIAIAGPYRSGKSYLMNRLAKQNKHGFTIGNGVDAKTKGIWVWCLIHPVYSDQVMILLDTEGIGDIDKSNSDNDNKLLCIATLICSTFIYNVKGVISLETLEKLGFVTYYARKVLVSGDKQENTYSSDIGLYFPDFVLTLRDFSHDLKNETPNAYLERMLSLKEGKEQESYNQIRAYIQKFFKKRECFIFDTPVPGRKNLAKLECTDEKDLLESFKEDSVRFIDNITKYQPKILFDGKGINGNMFSSLVKTYVNVFNSDGIPCIDNALTIMARHENGIVVRKVAESFRVELNKNELPVFGKKKILELYKREKRRFSQEFRSKCVLKIEDSLYDELEEKIAEIWKEYYDKNIQIQMSRCLSEMEKEYALEITKKMKAGIYGDVDGYYQYYMDLNQVKSKMQKMFPEMDNTLLRKVYIEFRDRHLQDDKLVMDMTEQSKKKMEDNHNEEMEKIQKEFERKLQEDRDKYQSLNDEHKKQRSIEEENYKKKMKESEKKNAKYLSILETEITANKPTVLKTVARATSSLLPVIGPVVYDICRSRMHKERREKQRKQIDDMREKGETGPASDSTEKK